MIIVTASRLFPFNIASDGSCVWCLNISDFYQCIQCVAQIAYLYSVGITVVIIDRSVIPKRSASIKQEYFRGPFGSVNFCHLLILVSQIRKVESIFTCSILHVLKAIIWILGCVIYIYGN